MRIKSLGFFLLMGGALIAAALLAETFGLDNDPGWGKGRVAILVFGILIIAWGVFYSFYTDTALSMLRKVGSLTLQNAVRLFELFKRYWYTFPILAFVLLVYIWFASSGSWTHWHSATNYYANLANGFKKGQLYLTIEPNPKLLSLSNPYDPVARRGVSFPVDYSLYNRKFYLYWGPVPALLLVMINPSTQARIGDLYLVFSFISGIFLLQFLLALTIWDRFFRDLPKWILALSILVIGLLVPWVYMLINEPNGRIYEAAISGGQFFLISGLLVAVLALRNSVSSSLALALTGFLWALAIGTRLTLVLPVGFMTLMVAYRLWKTLRTSPGKLAARLISLGSPLLLGFVGLGWYNWARFGSVTETGFSYQLAGPNLQAGSLFLPKYIIPNLYIYLFHPPSAMAQFPFLYPKEISPVTGLLFIAPFTLFALLPMVTLFRNAIQKKPSGSPDNSNDFLDWIILSLIGAFLSAFVSLVIFFWTAIRYLADLMPALSILSLIGFWQGYRFLTRRPVPRKIYSVLAIIFASTSLIVNILISMAVKQFGRTGF